MAKKTTIPSKVKKKLSINTGGITREASTAELGDARLPQRLKVIMAAFLNSPDKSPLHLMGRR